jgi:hypothetical protein
MTPGQAAEGARPDAGRPGFFPSLTGRPLRNILTIFTIKMRSSGELTPTESRADPMKIATPQALTGVARNPTKTEEIRTPLAARVG